jgi:hypothetical protein
VGNGLEIEARMLPFYSQGYEAAMANDIPSSEMERDIGPYRYSIFLLGYRDGADAR